MKHIGHDHQGVSLANLQEIELNTDELSTRGCGFYARAVIKGLEILYGIYITTRELLDVQKELLANTQSKQKALTPEEASRVLQISKNKLRSMKERGVLIEGVHYIQDESTVRYHANLETVFVERELQISTNTNSEIVNADSFADRQAAKQHTKNAFKN